jgi:hypothetical protein
MSACEQQEVQRLRAQFSLASGAAMHSIARCGKLSWGCSARHGPVILSTARPARTCSMSLLLFPPDLPVQTECLTGCVEPRSFVGSTSASARLALRLRTHVRTSPSLQARLAGDRGVHSGTEASTASAHSEILSSRSPAVRLVSK